ncbi:MAG: type II toxin-antitoxin system PemK/MazF family toxin [Bacteroidota bacterium]|nr:type II toxin-antitoxin system PemK/MazF family toxin [Bacteroidota bacterium]MDP4232201.1 type II toxin-antitoxin system PemK/MazF family toxin [Bacteroidota bacterium]MDP4243618.1 type II toxin-antitoxin system PemK/MazF family toxin [Bacteroidota bacterium]MDP4288728.1 type II toxin-antitoxin system PemK/MazF family toxin [Bacteroidota bacterium]
MKSRFETLGRGDIIRVVLDPVKGHEQSGIRPAVVLSPLLINEFSSTILVAAITSKRLDRILSVEVLIEAPEGGLKSDSKVLLLQTRSIDKSRIVGVYGSLSQETMNRVDQALAIATGLMKL